MKKFFLISSLNLLWHSLFPPILPLVSWEKRPTPNWILQLHTRLVSYSRNSLEGIKSHQRATAFLLFIHSITPSPHEAFCSCSSVLSTGTWGQTPGWDSPATLNSQTHLQNQTKHKTSIQNALLEHVATVRWEQEGLVLLDWFVTAPHPALHLGLGKPTWRGQSAPVPPGLPGHRAGETTPCEIQLEHGSGTQLEPRPFQVNRSISSLKIRGWKASVEWGI